MGGAQRQGEAFAGGFQPVLVDARQRAVLAQPRQVEEGIGAMLALLLALAGGGDQAGGAGGVVALLPGRGEGGGFAGDGQVQVDAVQQGAGEFVAVALDLLGRAATAPGSRRGRGSCAGFVSIIWSKGIS